MIFDIMILSYYSNDVLLYCVGLVCVIYHNYYCCVKEASIVQQLFHFMYTYFNYPLQGNQNDGPNFISCLDFCCLLYDLFLYGLRDDLTCDDITEFCLLLRNSVVS